MARTCNRHRWTVADWWECNIGVSPDGWRLLCNLDGCTSPRHWSAPANTTPAWAVTMYCAVEPSAIARALELRARLVDGRKEVGWFRVRDLTYTAALRRQLAMEIDAKMLSNMTRAIEATADLLWREYGLNRASEYSVFAMISGPSYAAWWFGLLIRTDRNGRIEFGLATTAGELEALLEIKPSGSEQEISSPH